MLFSLLFLMRKMLDLIYLTMSSYQTIDLLMSDVVWWEETTWEELLLHDHNEVVTSDER